jgi:hypothetical protein
MYSISFIKILVSIFTKIRPLGAESLHADRRADTTKLIVAFRSSSKAPKNWLLLQLFYETPLLNKFWSIPSALSHEEKKHINWRKVSSAFSRKLCPLIAQIFTKIKNT